MLPLQQCIVHLQVVDSQKKGVPHQCVRAPKRTIRSLRSKGKKSCLTAVIESRAMVTGFESNMKAVATAARMPCSCRCSMMKKKDRSMLLCSCASQVEKYI